MSIVYGSELSKEIKAQLKDEISLLKGRQPQLAVILVGDDPASQSYVKGKNKACNEVGILCQQIDLPANTSQDELLKLIAKLNNDPLVDGILVQLPLPEGINQKLILESIDPGKDVDGLHPFNAGKLMLGEEGFYPCTPLGIIELLKKMEVDIKGKNAVIIGRSNLVGLPLARLLIAQDATVTVCHSKTANLKEICCQADILIAAIGKPRFFTTDYIKEGAWVIDVGVNRVEGKLCGDVDFDNVKDKCKAITPVPKGVGPMTITMLLTNTLKAYKLHEGL